MIINITTKQYKKTHTYIYTMPLSLQDSQTQFPKPSKRAQFLADHVPCSVDWSHLRRIGACAGNPATDWPGWLGRGCSTASVGSMPISSECETSSDLVGWFGTWATCVGTTGCLLFVALSFFFPAQARWHCRMATANDKSNILNMRWVSGSLCRTLKCHWRIFPASASLISIFFFLVRSMPLANRSSYHLLTHLSLWPLWQEFAL